MAAMSRLLPLMALSSFVICLLAVLATPTNALASEHAHTARGHDSISKRKRNAVKRAKRCRPKTTSLAVSSTSTAAPSETPTSSSSQVYTHTHATTKAPSATLSSSQAVATTSAAASTGSGGSGSAGLDPNKKFLMAWPNGKWDLGKWKGGKNVGGIYSWSPDDPVPGSGTNYDFFPMVWGFNQKTSFANNIDGSKYKLCFGPNEPNQVGQSDMSPADAVTLWKSTIEPARAKGCKTVSPATTSAPSGKIWLQEFLKLCTGCNVDYVAIHWYDVSITAFQAYVTDFHTTFGKPMIVSEYACQNFNNGPQCTTSETWAMHTAMAKWFKQTDWVALVAPFGAMREMQGVNADNQMMNDDGSMNALGAFYMNGDW